MRKKIKLFLFLFLFLIPLKVFSKNIESNFYKRIVSLTLSGDEMLLSLVDDSRIVGLSGKINQDKDFSYVVESSKKFPRVESNIETLIELEPDFVIAADWMKRDVLSQIEDVTDNLYIYKTPKTFIEQKKLIQELARIFMVENRGKKIVEDMEVRLERLQEKIKKSYSGKKPRILLYTSYETTAGFDTSFNDLVEVIYCVNAAAEIGIKGSEKISKEKIIEIDPDIIVIPVWSSDSSPKFADFVKNDTSFKDLKAIKSKKVIVVPYRVTTPTSQYMIDGIEILAEKVYNLK